MSLIAISPLYIVILRFRSTFGAENVCLDKLHCNLIIYEVPSNNFERQNQFIPM